MNAPIAQNNGLNQIQQFQQQKLGQQQSIQNRPNSNGSALSNSSSNQWDQFFAQTSPIQG
jgi:hypothetical protein